MGSSPPKPWFEVAPDTYCEFLERLGQVRKWREAEAAARRTPDLGKFFEENGWCFPCKSTGTHLRPASFQGRLPLYIVCPACDGTGKVAPAPADCL